MTRFRPLWMWDSDESAFYARQITGTCLHVCCGTSRVGDVRLDRWQEGGATVIADYRALPFAEKSFDTVICDPPWAKNEALDAGLKWLKELGRVARLRIVIVHHVLFTIRGWQLMKAWCVNKNGMLWKVCQVHEPLPALVFA